MALLRESSRIETMILEQLLTCESAIMTNKASDTASIQKTCSEMLLSGMRKESIIYFWCSGPNPFAKDCKQGCLEGTYNRVCRLHHEVRCFHYNKVGHISSECLENSSREEMLTPASAPNKYRTIHYKSSKCSLMIRST